MTRRFLEEGSNASAIDCVKALDATALEAALACGEDPNAGDENDMTALHHVAAMGARPCLRVLVASGKCDYLLRDKFGRYASDIAIEWSRDYAMARLLTKHQARQAFERGVAAYVLTHA